MSAIRTPIWKAQKGEEASAVSGPQHIQNIAEPEDQEITSLAIKLVLVWVSLPTPAYLPAELTITIGNRWPPQVKPETELGLNTSSWYYNDLSTSYWYY